MTWGEFKAAVEQSGIDDDSKIHWIDVTYPNTKLNLKIARRSADNAFSIEDAA